MVKKNDFYSSASTSRTEIDLRSEYLNTMYGKGSEIAKSQKGLLRRFRADRTELCPCVNRVTGEPDRETRCPICLGEGYLWDEEPIDFYHLRNNSNTSSFVQDVQQNPGIMNTETEIFHIPYQFSLTKNDKLVTLVLDKEGFPTYPNKRFQLFRIAELQPLRLDNGRLEFWKAFTYEDNSKFL